MIPTRLTDQSSGSVDLLTDKSRGKAVTEGVLKALTKPFDRLETDTWDVIEKRVLGTATAAQLDVLGVIVGEPRLGRSDAEYEIVIRLAIRARRSQGRTIDVLDVLTLSGLPFRYEEHYPAGFRVELFDVPNGPDVAAWVFVAKALGVRANVVFASTSEGGTFAADSVTGNVYTGNVYASVTNRTLGYPLASVRAK